MSIEETSAMQLALADGTIYEGISFGDKKPAAGEVVFNTGMVGYPEALTDPSYRGQILVLTYPLIGNYGVPGITEDKLDPSFESNRIQIAGLVVSTVSYDYSHPSAVRSLSEWLKSQGVPAVTGVDTRRLTKRLREYGTILGKLKGDGADLDFFDPGEHNLVSLVSLNAPITYQGGKKRVLLIDCGCKNNIIRSLVDRGCTVLRAPWDCDFNKFEYDGLLISNGPGNPKMCSATIENIRKALENDKPIFGICLGNQLLALAAGADTYKLKYGHRSQNQPCLISDGDRCFITSQNHGYAVDSKSLPSDWKAWFTNANDGTNEGLRHKTKPFMSVQFHPEASPGPTDTSFLFDEFVSML